jgi:para-aminobenzoate synthetase component I
VRGSAAEWPSLRDRVRATFSTISPDPALPPFQGGWIGWLAYELGTAFDRVPRHRQSPPGVPDVALSLYDWVIAWDHSDGCATLISSGIDAVGARDNQRAIERARAVIERWERLSSATPPTVTTRSTAAAVANFSRAGYEAAVERVVEYVLAGDLFQANLAQSFSAAYDRDPLSLYRALMQQSPAPMAAFLQHDEVAIVSASPERFLRLEQPSRRVETRPIKGTRPRDHDAERDATLARALVESEKDRAENVMIVDLMRNDLSRVCRPGSVTTPSLCALESHATVHHLVSTVVGALHPAHDALDLIAATFPGGSITGAPKLRAMEIIHELEPIARGVYSGAIIWIGLDGALDASIAIRTITVAGGTATFHVGGGITARSNAAEEYQETLDKGRALVAALQRAS